MSLTTEPRRIDTTYMPIPGRTVWTSQNEGSATMVYAPFEPNRTPKRPWFYIETEPE